MSKFFRKLIFCGCSSSRSGLDGRSIVVEESLVDDPPPKFAEFSNYDVVPEEPDVARHFDLSAIKFIDDDEEEADGDACCTENGSGGDRSDFSFFIEKWVVTRGKPVVIPR